jgi:hypothetical protein
LIMRIDSGQIVDISIIKGSVSWLPIIVCSFSPWEIVFRVIKHGYFCLFDDKQ